jgi:hypothetical protein
MWEASETLLARRGDMNLSEVFSLGHKILEWRRVLHGKV